MIPETEMNVFAERCYKAEGNYQQTNEFIPALYYENTVLGSRNQQWTVMHVAFPWYLTNQNQYLRNFLGLVIPNVLKVLELSRRRLL